MTSQVAVPFWLQVTTVALAPMLGFVGVAIGSYSQSRNSRKLALRSHRQDVYTSFLEAAEHYHSLFHIKLSSAFKVGHDAQREEFMEQVLPHRDAFYRAYSQVSLVASRRTAMAAKRVNLYTTFYAAAILDALSDSYNNEEWNEVARRSFKAIRAFQAEASRDLGLPKWQANSMNRDLEFDEFELTWASKKSPIVDELNERLKQKQENSGSLDGG